MGSITVTGFAFCGIASLAATAGNANKCGHSTWFFFLFVVFALLWFSFYSGGPGHGLDPTDTTRGIVQAYIGTNILAAGIGLTYPFLFRDMTDEELAIKAAEKHRAEEKRLAEAEELQRCRQYPDVVNPSEGYDNKKGEVPRQQAERDDLPVETLTAETAEFPLTKEYLTQHRDYERKQDKTVRKRLRQKYGNAAQDLVPGAVWEPEVPRSKKPRTGEYWELPINDEVPSNAAGRRLLRLLQATSGSENREAFSRYSDPDSRSKRRRLALRRAMPTSEKHREPTVPRL